jgi:OmpA-OmpF porin, OOP family
MRRSTVFTTTLYLVCFAITACNQEPRGANIQDVADDTPAAVPVSTDLKETPAPIAKNPATSIDVAAAEFSVDSVPVSNIALPPFPFFKTPDGLVNNLDDKKSMTNFDQHYFLAGKKLVLVEGMLYHNEINLVSADKSREYSPLEFHRNYENAILALGGKKISEIPLTGKIANEAGGLSVVNQHWKCSPPTSTYQHASYLLRNAENEYWIHVGTSPKHGYIVVLEKAIMKQSLGFLDASAMKKALDTDGHVALYINFDIDKATLRADSQGTVDEINKLMSSNPEMKLSIEGHTDSTGAADHNRQLSTARARSVLGTLVGLGIDPVRLSSKGFGPDKPIADNASEQGRAKNRRVELVKME